MSARLARTLMKGVVGVRLPAGPPAHRRVSAQSDRFSNRRVRQRKVLLARPTVTKMMPIGSRYVQPDLQRQWPAPGTRSD